MKSSILLVPLIHKAANLIECLKRRKDDMPMDDKPRDTMIVPNWLLFSRPLVWFSALGVKINTAQVNRLWPSSAAKSTDD